MIARTSQTLTRRTFLGAAAAAAGTLGTRTATLQAQPSAPVVTRTDVIYGRVEGSALLANLAYPDGPGLRPGDYSDPGWYPAPAGTVARKVSDDPDFGAPVRRKPPG
jgi:hypothetical protein